MNERDRASRNRLAHVHLRSVKYMLAWDIDGLGQLRASFANARPSPHYFLNPKRNLPRRTA